jgi:hypothetical protein
MDDVDELGQAVAGFHRAEAALAAIVADADRLVDARAEVEQARDELKVVAGALVGLASASRELVGQLGEAAAALRPPDREDDRLVVAWREAEATRARQVAEVAEAVEELARRLDRALVDRMDGVVAQLVDRLPSAEQVEGLAGRLDGLEDLARADRVAELTSVVERLPSASDLGALEGRLLERLPADEAGPTPATGPGAEEVAELAATGAAQAVQAQMVGLLEQVEAGQRRMRQLVLAVGVSFLLFAALVSVLALR